MVDVARYFVDLLTGESCGKCLPCREGLRQMHAILTRITQGMGREGDVETLQDLSETAVEASLCALGKTAPNPFLSTLRYFRDEYEAHIREKRCPAGVCRALVGYAINDKCIGDAQCAKVCPTGSISGELKVAHGIDQEKCNQCVVCRDHCRVEGAIVVQ